MAPFHQKFLEREVLDMTLFLFLNHIKTFAEFSKFKKMKIDHRFIAFKKLKKKIKTL